MSGEGTPEGPGGRRWRWWLGGAAALGALALALGAVGLAWVRAREGREGRELERRLTLAEGHYVGHQWRRRPAGGPARECNALVEAVASAVKHNAVWEGWDGASEPDRLAAVADLRLAVHCTWSFAPGSFAIGPHARPPFDYGPHSIAVGSLVKLGAKLSPRECLALELDAVRLAHDFVPGGRGLHVSIGVSREQMWAIEAALACLGRATREDLQGVVANYLEVAADRPPVQWTFEFELLQDAELESAFFRGRPLLPTFWSTDSYPLTAGSRILSRFGKNLADAQRVTAVAENAPGYLDSLAARVPSDHYDRGLLDPVARSITELRALACGMWELSYADAAARPPRPTLCAKSAGREGREILTRGDGDWLVAYGSGQNDRDEQGHGDDEGVRIPLTSLGKF